MTICSIDGCDRTLWARGWCKLHYDRWRRHGTTDLWRADDRPLVCDCKLSQPDAIDECVRCHRVVAERVHERRARRALRAAS